GHEPGGRERQLALARRLAGDFLVEPQQPLVRQVGLRFEHLQARAQADQRDGAADLLGFGEDALGAHDQAASWCRPASRIEACRREVAALAALLPWLVSRPHTMSPSMRQRHRCVLPDALLLICAGPTSAI